MFKGYRKAAVGSGKKGRKTTIREKRQLVIDRIDAWLAILNGEQIKGVQRLSKLEGGSSRLVWLKYGLQNVPLTDSGDLVGEIDAAEDEVAFWQWMRSRVQTGAYDGGIMAVAETIYRRMKAV
jgi:hypothetical protein